MRRPGIVAKPDAASLPQTALPARDRAQLSAIAARSGMLDRAGAPRPVLLFSGSNAATAAAMMAKELRRALYRVDLSAIVSKYLGETEKNLARAFAAAERAAAVLLFDEADALFGKRTEVNDAHDRYANIEIGYLLQRIEQYAGIVILASRTAGPLGAWQRQLRAYRFPPDGA